MNLGKRNGFIPSITPFQYKMTDITAWECVYKKLRYKRAEKYRKSINNLYDYIMTRMNYSLIIVEHRQTATID